MKIKLSDQLYDVLRWVVALVLPALATLYVAFGHRVGMAIPPGKLQRQSLRSTHFLGAILCIGTNYSTSGKKKKRFRSNYLGFKIVCFPKAPRLFSTPSVCPCFCLSENKGNLYPSAKHFKK